MLLSLVKGFKYEDERIDRETFATMKKSGQLPSGQVPLYTDEEGIQMNQSYAILRLLGRKNGFYSDKNLKESYTVDWALETSLDLWGTKAIYPWMSRAE